MCLGAHREHRVSRATSEAMVEDLALRSVKERLARLLLAEVALHAGCRRG